MYPDFRYLVYGLTGYFPPEWVGLFKTFGAIVAIAFLVGTWVLMNELKRKEKEGLLSPTLDAKKGVMVWPHQRISEIIMICALGGLVGAKVFNALETWDDFIQDPIGSLFSRSGLTFYGGLIVATAILYYYAKRHKIRFAHLCDAAAPALILAYGIGRLGCQFAGDGDWGIYNSAYITTVDGSLVQAPPDKYKEALTYYKSTLRNPSRADSSHKYAPAPSWAPRWLWAQNYPRNVGRDGVEMNDCPSPEYCTVLPISVFPTPVYESIVCIGLFFFLWGIRRRLRRPWQMFGVYLIINGLERFFVEQIRVNYKYDWGFIHPTQAEIIAVGLMLCGLALLLVREKKRVELAT
jgi:phosphatidylglycerol:prolipoprotein diacylglycerol transferase